VRIQIVLRRLFLTRRQNAKRDEKKYYLINSAIHKKETRIKSAPSGSDLINYTIHKKKFEPKPRSGDKKVARRETSG
jgi:hypothetical protein